MLGAILANCSAAAPDLSRPQEETFVSLGNAYSRSNRWRTVRDVSDAKVRAITTPRSCALDFSRYHWFSPWWPHRDSVARFATNLRCQIATRSPSRFRSVIGSDDRVHVRLAPAYNGRKT